MTRVELGVKYYTILLNIPVLSGQSGLMWPRDILDTCRMCTKSTCQKGGKGKSWSNAGT